MDYDIYPDPPTPREREAARYAEQRIAALEAQLAELAHLAGSYKFADKPHRLFSALARLVERQGGDRSVMDHMYERIGPLLKAEAQLAEARAAERERCVKRLREWGDAAWEDGDVEAGTALQNAADQLRDPGE